MPDHPMAAGRLPAVVRPHPSISGWVGTESPGESGLATRLAKGRTIAAELWGILLLIDGVGWESLQSLRETNGNHGQLQLALVIQYGRWTVYVPFMTSRDVLKLNLSFSASLFWSSKMIWDDLFVFYQNNGKKPCNHQGFGSQLEDFLLFCRFPLVHVGAPARTGAWLAWSLDLWLRSSEHLPHCPSMRRMTLRAMAEMRVGLLIPNFATDWHMSWFPGLDSCWEHW